jgi:hypothetical protein
MTNNKILLGMLALALILGMTLVGCGDDDVEPQPKLHDGTDGLSFGLNYSGGAPNGGYWVSKGTATAAKIVIPSVYNGQPVTAIASFSNYTTMTSVIIPDSVTSIGGGAFSGCTGLTSVTIPDSVTSIDSRAFYGCTGLTSVTIGNSFRMISSTWFLNCTGLASITVASGNPVYRSEGNCLIRIAENSLWLGCKNSVIPDSVTSIGSDAFSGGAFQSCTGLTSLTIPDSVTSIGWKAFHGCTGLTSVTIPDSVTSIGEWAFWDCTGLTSVTIPASVTSIGNHAFDGCTGLKSVTFETGSNIKLSNFGEGAFPELDKLSGNHLRTAYLSGGAGTYTKVKGETWIKQ